MSEKYKILYKEVKGADLIKEEEWLLFQREVDKLIDFLPKLRYFKIDRLEFKNLPKTLAYYEMFYNHTLIVISTKDGVQFSSFVHEVAHHLDYSHINNKGEVVPYTQRNQTPSWKRLVKMFRDHHSQYANKVKSTHFNGSIKTVKTYWKSIDQDYRNASEIFARAFEIYIATTTNIEMIVPKIDKLKKQKSAYPLEKHQVQQIKEFFEMYFKDINVMKRKI